MRGQFLSKSKIIFTVLIPTIAVASGISIEFFGTFTPSNHNLENESITETEGTHVAFARSGNLGDQWLAGYALTDGPPLPFGEDQRYMFLSRIDSEGNERFSKVFGTPDSRDFPRGLSVSSSGEVVVSGYNLPSSGVYRGALYWFDSRGNEVCRIENSGPHYSNVLYKTVFERNHLLVLTAILTGYGTGDTDQGFGIQRINRNCQSTHSVYFDETLLGLPEGSQVMRGMAKVGNRFALWGHHSIGDEVWAPLLVFLDSRGNVAEVKTFEDGAGEFMAGRLSSESLRVLDDGRLMAVSGVYGNTRAYAFTPDGRQVLCSLSIPNLTGATSIAPDRRSGFEGHAYVIGNNDDSEPMLAGVDLNQCEVSWEENLAGQNPGNGHTLELFGIDSRGSRLSITGEWKQAGESSAFVSGIEVSP